MIALAPIQFAIVRIAAIDNMSTNDPGCIPITLYLWRQIRIAFTFYISSKILLFPSTLNTYETTLDVGAIQKQALG